MMVNDNIIKLRDLTEKLFKVGEPDIVKSIINLTCDLFCIADREKILKVSDNWCKVLGYSEKELTNMPWIELICDHDVEKVKQITEKVMPDRDIIDFTSRIKSKDGRCIEVVWRATKWNSVDKTFSFGRLTSKEEKHGH